MPDRLEYLKQTLDKQKGRTAVVLRRADAEWVVSEAERLGKRIDIIYSAMNDILDQDDLNSIDHNIAIYEKAVFK
jgi:hypothetical protein